MVITSVLLFMAIFLPKALPPMVSDDIKAVMIRVINNPLIFVILISNATIVTPALPDIIPQISPIKSQQTLDTLLAFLISFTPTLPLRTLLALIEWNTTSSPQVTETPIISKIIPNNMKKKVTIIDIIKVTFLNIILVKKDIIKDKINANNVTIIIQL